MKATVTVTESDPGWLKALMRRYAEQAVLAVGWPKGTESVGIKYPDGTPVLLVAAANNFGAPNIPARPFMSEAQEPAVNATQPVAAVMVKKVNAGKATITDALNEMAPYAEAAFKQTITDLSDPPNAPSTIAQKGSDNPLIDTGLMRNSLTTQVRPG